MFISLSSTCIQNFSDWHALFCFLFNHILQQLRHEMGYSVWIHFELFYHLVRGIQFNHQTHLIQFRQLKKYILGIHPKKIIIPAPFHTKAFVLLYNFKTSWALIGRLSRGFFAISGASNFKHFKQLFMTLLFGLLTM